MASSTYKITQSRKDVTPALFVVASGLQNLGAPVYGLEISQSMKDITGEKAVCVMKSEGVWRLTTQTKAERAQILLRGLTIRGHTITVLSTNPRLVNGEQTIRRNTMVERRMETSVSDVASPQIIIPQQDLVPGSQLTIDNFTSFKSRSRSLTKDAISKTRERSSSKRKTGPLKETPKGKRSTKNKKSPKQKTNQGSKTNEQDRVSKGTPSGNTGGNTQSAEYFDYWLNKQVRTSPT